MALSAKASPTQHLLSAQQAAQQPSLPRALPPGWLPDPASSSSVSATAGSSKGAPGWNVPQSAGNNNAAIAAARGNHSKAVTSTTSTSGFQVGERVEYWSNSKQKWLPTSVLVAQYKLENVGLVYDLACKKGAHKDLVRASQRAPKAKVGQEDEAAWAALEDAEKAVAQALNQKFKSQQQQPVRQSARRGAARPVAGNGTVDGPGHATIGSARGSVKRDAAGVQKFPALKGADPTATSAATAHPRGKFSIGSKVEYWSKNQRKWLTASVKAVRTGKQGTVSKYDLDCKKQVPVWRLRAPRSNAAGGGSAAAGQHAPVFQAGAEVRYWSATVKKWVKAVVKEVHGGTSEQKEMTYTLNVKPKVEADKVRAASTPSNAPPPGSVTGTSDKTSLRKPSLAGKPAAKKVDGQDSKRVFQIHDNVEYWSKKSSCWLDAVVEAKREPGGSAPAVYDLRSRKLLIKGATAAWMRPPVGKNSAQESGSKSRSALAAQKRRAHEKAARAATAVYNVGEKIHYWSKKSNSWILGVVESKSDPGNGMPTVYDLRCKKMLVRGVLSKQLREAAVAGAGAVAEMKIAVPAAKSKRDLVSEESRSKRPRVEEQSAAAPPAQTSSSSTGGLNKDMVGSTAGLASAAPACPDRAESVGTSEARTAAKAELLSSKTSTLETGEKGKDCGAESTQPSQLDVTDKTGIQPAQAAACPTSDTGGSDTIRKQQPEMSQGSSAV